MSTLSALAPPANANPVTPADLKRTKFFNLAIPTPFPIPDAPNVADPGDTWGTWDDVADLPWGLGPDADPIELPAPALAKLAILGYTYTVREIPAGECGEVAYRLHKTETGNTYTVIRNHFGLVTCDCGDYQFRHEGSDAMCKHGNALVARGYIPAPSPTPSTVGRREFVTPSVSVYRDSFPERMTFPAPRARRFDPTPDEQAEAAQLFGDLAAERDAHRRELAAAL